MSLLADSQITAGVRSGSIGITPFYPDHVNPASYDLTLAAQIRVPHAPYPTTSLDVAKIEPDYTVPWTISPDHGWRLDPQQFLLATSVERIQVPLTMAARAEGKSSLGRIGLMVHVTAGYIDPGFSGQVTLEIFNCLNRPIVLRAGMRIAQLAFFVMSRVPQRSYASTGHYQDQSGPTESRYALPVPVPAAEEIDR